MGRVVVCAVAAVLVVLVSVSCSKRRTVGSNYGLAYCDGTLGTFDVYTVPNQNGLYGIYVVPVNLVQPGDVIKVTIANKSLGYKELQPQVVAQDGEEIYAGVISANELQTYNILAITPFEAGTTFLQGSADADAYCSLPIPGDNPSAQ